MCIWSVFSGILGARNLGGRCCHGCQKIQVLLDWPLPRTVRAVQGFLGLAGYYGRFIKDYGAITTPLTVLLCKDSFRWSPEMENEKSSGQFLVLIVISH
jgi:hypothetical protein